MACSREPEVRHSCAGRLYELADLRQHGSRGKLFRSAQGPACRVRAYGLSVETSERFGGVGAEDPFTDFRLHSAEFVNLFEAPVSGIY